MSLHDKLLNLTTVDLKDSPESIPIVESNDPLVRVNPSNRILVNPIWDMHPYSSEGRLCKDYLRMQPSYGMYLRSSVAKRLHIASSKLPENWTIVLVAGHRPIEVQQNLYNECFRSMTKKFPDHSKNEVAKLTREFVADPTRKSPSHCCGAAVDILVIDNTTGFDVDFGSKINTVSKKSYIYSKNISRTAMNNRMILLEAMISSGFSSLYSEWWHFSYGDQNWAAFYQKPKAIYGIKDV